MNAPTTCPACNSASATERDYKDYHYEECGLDNVWLTRGVTRITCPDCKQVHVLVHDEQQLLQTIALNLLVHQSDPSGPELRYLRRACHLSQDALAQQLRTRRETIAERESKPDPKLSRAETIGVRLVLLKSFLDYIGGEDNCYLSHRQKEELVAFTRDYCTRVIDDAAKSVKKLRFHRDGAKADWEPVAQAA